MAGPLEGAELLRAKRALGVRGTHALYMIESAPQPDGGYLVRLWHGERSAVYRVKNDDEFAALVAADCYRVADEMAGRIGSFGDGSFGASG